MKDIMENFKHFLVEQKSIYTMEFKIVAEEGTALYGKIFEAIRGFQGVTVIRSTEKIERDPHNNKHMILSVRFYVNPADANQYVTALKTYIATLRDSDNKRILTATISKLPEKVDQLYT